LCSSLVIAAADATIVIIITVVKIWVKNMVCFVVFVVENVCFSFVANWICELKTLELLVHDPRSDDFH
jgi:hypothetical protein